MYGAPTPRERERWHGLWLLAQGWSAIKVAEALEREPHTIGNWLANFRRAGAQGLVFEHTGVPPPTLNAGQQDQLKSAVLNLPGEAGIELSNWNWKVVRQFLKRSFDLGLSRSSCLNYLHRLGFVLKRPKKRLLKAKDEERKAFIIQYRQIREEAQESGAQIFFVDEAHFRADADIGCRMGGNGCSRESQRWWTPPVTGGERRPATTREFVWRLGRWKPWK